ncbi:bi-domain-containing oxidoreductase [Candidatus Parcubacteria bacterium]|nr:bi-domain-containing oxidoreductase [Candidatus Parcubacteria bacterium]
MKQVVQNYKTRELEVQEVPAPIIRPGGVLVRNINSLISIGTEKLMINLAKKNLFAKVKSRPDLVKKVINKVKQEGLFEAYRQAMARLEEPLPLGYSSAGKLIEVGQGADEFQVGDRVACAGHKFASHAEIIYVPRNLCVKIPENVSFEEACFVDLGAIALHGVRTGEPTLGEKAVVIGLGLLGQIAVQILKASGLRVFGVDINEDKTKLAKELGADEVAVINKDDIQNRVKSFSQGVGADIVYIFASTYSNQPIELAGEIARERGKVVITGEITINIPRKVYYEKELKVVVSRSSGPGIYDSLYEKKGIDYPIAYVRWTLRRNLEEFLKLIGEKKVRLEPLITHRFKIDDALKAYEMILGETKENYIGVLLKYEENKKEIQKINLNETKIIKKSKKEEINVGLIGAGLHSKGVILPTIKQIPKINLLGIADAEGVNARFIGEKFDFKYCTTNYKQILNDTDIDAVVIATPHNLHAKMLKDALGAGKDIFIEKPLAMNEVQLKEIIKIYNQTSARVMVGLNRRFSPFSVLVKELFSWYKGPFAVNCRVNIGYIPPDHWTHDLSVGGGSIIGEGCHFIDLIQFLTGSLPMEVYAKTISGKINEHISNDNVLINLKMSSGSIASIVYTALGTRAYPRERIEIFGGGAVAVIDNFKSMLYVQNGRKKKKSTFDIDKGYKDEFRLFFEAIQKGEETPVKFKEYLFTTLTTFKIIESIQKNTPQIIDINVLNS